MSTIDLLFKKCREKAQIPSQMTEGASGYDVCACVEEVIHLAPLQRKRIPTGIMVELPLGWELQVRPRSGLAWKKGLTVLNSPGTIDSDYRGEIEILVINLGQEEISLTPQERIAQLVLQAVTKINWIEKDKLTPSFRDEQGFGSTGTGT